MSAQSAQKPVKLSGKQAVRAYCPNKYTVPIMCVNIRKKADGIHCSYYFKGTQQNKTMV